MRFYFTELSLLVLLHSKTNNTKLNNYEHHHHNQYMMNVKHIFIYAYINW